MHHTELIPLPAIGGSPFIAYAGKDGTVYLERVRPNGVRDSNSIFQFDADELLAVVSHIVRSSSSLTTPIAVMTEAA